MRSVLMVTPSFPPASGAATHRVRLLAPHLPADGWHPIVATLDAPSYEESVDEDLLALVPDGLDVHRFAAVRPSTTRRLGFGDLGARSFLALARGCARLVEQRRPAALFVTLPPNYTALLGRFLAGRGATPYVLDYQDPWVGAWGDTTGGGPGGRPDARSRLSRLLALALEPGAVRHAAGLTAVSEGTLHGVLEREPGLRRVPRAEIPFGFEPTDLDSARRLRASTREGGSQGRQLHIGFVGTIAPLAGEVVDAFLEAVALVRRRLPELGARLRLRFVGTSGQVSGDPAPKLRESARRNGVDDLVEEHPLRVDYLSALRVLLESDVLLLLGSSEAHYTASRLAQTLGARKPVLAVFHESSPVSTSLAPAAAEAGSGVNLVTYGASRRPVEAVPEIAEAVIASVRAAEDGVRPVESLDRLRRELGAPAQARRLARFLDDLVSAAEAGSRRSESAGG